MSAAVHSCSRMGGRGRHADRTPTMPSSFGRGCACGSSGSGPVSGRAPHQLPCPRWLRQGPPVSALMAGVREAAGHPSGPEIAADTGLATRAGHQPSGRRSFRKHPTVNPLTGPARYNFPYSSSRPALRPGNDTTLTVVPTHPPHQVVRLTRGVPSVAGTVAMDVLLLASETVAPGRCQGGERQRGRDAHRSGLDGSRAQCD